MLLKERKQGFYFCLCPTRIEFNKCSKQNITANLGSYSGIGGRIGQQMLAWVAIFMLSWIHRNLGVLLLPSALCFKSVQCFAKLVRHLGLNVHVMFICQVTALFQVERVVYSSMLQILRKLEKTTAFWTFQLQRSKVCISCHQIFNPRLYSIDSLWMAFRLGV